MNIKGYKIRTLFIKDLKLSLKNKNVIAVLLLPIGFALFYQYLFQGVQADGDIPQTFILMLCEVIALSCIPLQIQAMLIADEKEKKTWTTLKLSMVSYKENLLSKACVSFFYLLLVTFLNGMIGSIGPYEMCLFIIVSSLVAITILLYGTTLGLLAKDKTEAGTYILPLLVLFMVPSLFVYFTDLFSTFANFLPTYTFQTLYDEIVIGNYFSFSNLYDVGVILVWFVGGVILLRYVYRKQQKLEYEKGITSDM